MFIPSVIKSIQRGTITFGFGDQVKTATITSVNINASRTKFLGANVINAGSDSGFIRVELTNATTVTAYRVGFVTGPVVVSFEIIEYYPGLIKSIQRGTIDLNSVASNTATITAVVLTKSELNYLGNSTTDSTSGNASNWWVELVLTNTTTITASMGGSLLFDLIVGYEVIQWR